MLVGQAALDREALPQVQVEEAEVLGVHRGLVRLVARTVELPQVEAAAVLMAAAWVPTAVTGCRVEAVGMGRAARAVVLVEGVH
jgi:hypothetical protein